MYALLFLLHGLVYPVQPPDIGNSQTAEAVAGFVALVLLILGAVTIMWFLNGRRRWPFLLLQAATLGTAVFFLIDPRTQSWAVPGVLAFTSITAIVLAFAPESAAYVGSSVAWPWARKPERPGARRSTSTSGRRRAARAAAERGQESPEKSLLNGSHILGTQLSPTNHTGCRSSICHGSHPANSSRTLTRRRRES